MKPRKSKQNLSKPLVQLIQKLNTIEKEDQYSAGVTLPQASIVLSLKEPKTLKELSAAVGTAPSTTSRVADNLVKNGYLARTRDIKSDQRQVKFILTVEGYNLRDKLSGYRRELLESILDSIPKSKLPQVIESLELLNEAIDFTVLLSKSDQKQKTSSKAESKAKEDEGESIS